MIDSRNCIGDICERESSYSSYIGRCGPPPLLSLCISNWMRTLDGRFMIDRHRRPISRTTVALWASDNQSAILWPRVRMATTQPVMKWLNGSESLERHHPPIIRSFTRCRRTYHGRNNHQSFLAVFPTTDRPIYCPDQHMSATIDHRSHSLYPLKPIRNKWKAQLPLRTFTPHRTHWNQEKDRWISHEQESLLDPLPYLLSWRNSNPNWFFLVPDATVRRDGWRSPKSLRQSQYQWDWSTIVPSWDVSPVWCTKMSRWIPVDFSDWSTRSSIAVLISMIGDRR